MTGSGNLVNVPDIPDLIDEAEKCLSLARRNKQSIAGDNFYAMKFLELHAKMKAALDAIRADALANGDAGPVDAIDLAQNQVDVYFAVDASQAARRDARRQILRVYKAQIEPALSPRPLHAPTDALLPLEIVTGTREYIERIAAQACGCYDQGWYDACAVMVRRLLETLIIECFENAKMSGKIKDRNGNFLYLRGLIPILLDEDSWNLSRNTKAALPSLKEIGDLSAHSRYFTARKRDIDEIKMSLRVAVQELIAIAGLKPSWKKQASEPRSRG